MQARNNPRLHEIEVLYCVIRSYLFSLCALPVEDAAARCPVELMLITAERI